MLPVLAALVLALVLVWYFVFGGSKSKGPAVLLLGPCGGGKTLLFTRLVEGEVAETVSSMMANEASVEIEGRSTSVVDFPGHHRLRGPLASELKRATGIVFVLDASATTTQSKPAAELLYSILTSGTTSRILFLCNKSDTATVKTPARVKLMMANEIETLRKTTGAIDTLGDDGVERVQLDTQGQFFKFEAHSPCETTFLPFSAKTDKLDAVRDFLASCA